MQLLERFRIGREQPGPDPLEAAQARIEAAQTRTEEVTEALQAAQARIEELTKALQGLLELSDSSRSRDFAEVKRLLFYARTVLAKSVHH